MLNLGKVQPGSTIYIPFDSFAGSTGAPITMTNFAVGDIQIYKDGGTTQRASTSGFTLLDTDGIDFDGITGIHGFSIDLSDNTTADFYASGSKYFVVVSTVTIDSQTMSFLAAFFTIGEVGAILDTTIATLSSQTSFTLTAGPADNSALVGCVAVIHDAASAVQQCAGFVSAYTGASKTVTLIADPAIFTMAAKDNISFMPPQKSNLLWWNGTAPNALQSGRVDSYTGAMAADVITASAIATDAIGSAELAASAVSEIQSGLSTLDAAGIRTAVGLASANLDTQLTAIDDYIDTEVAAIKAKTDQLTFTTANRVDSQVFGMQADTVTASAIATDAIGSAELAASAVSEIQSGLSTLDAAGIRTAVGLASANLDTQLSTIDDYIDTEVAAIKAKTDNLPSDPADASDIAASFATVSSTLATIAAYIDTEVAAIKAVTDQFTAAQSEPSGVPAANASPLDKIAWMAVLARNKITQTATTQTLRNDADSSSIATSTHSDDLVTHIRGEWV